MAVESEEELKIKSLIEKIWKIREQRVLCCEEIDKQIEDLRRKHREAREKLIMSQTKLEVQMWTSVIKSLVGEKQLLDAKRHLVRLLHTEEADLQLELAKLKVKGGS